MKERNVEIIGISEAQTGIKDKFDFYIEYDNKYIEESLPSAVLLLTCGILNQREPGVYPKLYSGMETNIKKLTQYSKNEVENIFQSIVEVASQSNNINIVASATDVATQMYLKTYFEKEGKQVKNFKSGEFISPTHNKINLNEPHLLIYGMDSGKELDALAINKMEELGLNLIVFEVDKISNLDRPFAKIISSIIIFYAINNK